MFALLYAFLAPFRVYLLAALAVGAWFIYGWGSEIIHTYNNNIARITKLERDATLRESRLAVKQTVIERQRAAIDASKCKAQIDRFLKDPDLLKKLDPFQINGG